ncbi:MAG: ATP-dependent RNA helicase HrpA [Bifidobacteriaceae bacterium]|nr:ATP-dependent RNA helicase HrpA [Bifidobacteriaceae bacterium]
MRQTPTRVPGGAARNRPLMIAHTQPRRIAARATAERVAQELGTPLGQTVGYQVRFTDHSSASTRLKVMTDGVLLAQIQRDPQLRAYDAIIIDEAHERSLNIDFLLGYLSNLLPKRPDLKLIITSATIDSALFAAHFGRDADHPAPVIEVSGRTYPVDIRYRPPGQDGVPEDQPTAIVAAARELMRQGDGDILVFCSGEREIRDAADALSGDLGAQAVSGKGGARSGAPRGPRTALEVLPLYSRLSSAEQHRVFEPHSARRIVLATNVAETSLTVPGIHYVIDPGTARISRYSKATKVQRLPIEPVSQASANQRAGRCGRIAKGVCLRLYSREDFETRPAFTDPEILRTSLASVILQMLAVGVVHSPGEVARFPFVQPPDTRAVTDGVRVLQELGAIEDRDGRTRLTEAGRRLARIPLDPRLARMIIEAESAGVEREVTIIAAALSIQDPRERPLEFQAQADQSHARFNDPTSDFLSFLNLWEYLRAARRDNSSSAFRRLVRREYLNYLRIREWQDLVKELQRAARAGRDRRGGRPGDTQPSDASDGRSGGTQQTAAQSAGAQPRRSQPDDAAPNTARNKRSRRGARPDGPEPPGAQPSAACDGRPGGSLPDGAQSHGAAPDTARHGHDGRTKAAGTAASSNVLEAAGDAAKAEARRWRLQWPSDQIHRALLQGLLSQFGQLQATPVRAGGGARRPEPKRTTGPKQYLGARGIRFAIYPGSTLRTKPPAWVMAAELVETSRLWGRTCAAINPEWVEAAAPHLARRTYANPRWSAKRGAAVIDEKVLVYGLPVVAARPVALAQVDQAMARELFIRHALVEGDWRTHHRFYQANRELLERAEELAARSRTSKPLIGDEDLFDFYDQRLPASVTSARHFDAWWKRASRSEPELLTLTPELLAVEAQTSGEGFPDDWRQGEFVLPVTYEYSPGSPHDGVAVHIPIQYANQLPRDGFDWQVPGLRQDLIAALIKTLPKALRAELLPARDTARQALEALGPPADWRTADSRTQPLVAALSEVFRRLRGVNVPVEAWQPDALPDHLRITFLVEDPKGRVMASGHDLGAVVTAAAPDVSAAISRVVAASTKAHDAAGSASGGRAADRRAGSEHGLASDANPCSSGSATGAGASAALWPGTRERVTTWDFGDLATEVSAVDGAGHTVRGYPALVARSGQVSLRLLTDAGVAGAEMAAGVRELLLGELALTPQRLLTRLRPEQALPLAASHYASAAELTIDAQRAVIGAALGAAVPRRQADYEQLRADLRGRLEDAAFATLRTASDLVARGRGLEEAASRVTAPGVADSVADIRAHLGRLTGAGFLSRAGLTRLKDLGRYLAAEAYRLTRLGTNQAREQAALAELAALEAEVAAVAGTAASGSLEAGGNLAEVPWMIEELRVSLFAQQLGTAYPVSAKRIRKVLAQAGATTSG